MSSGYPDVVLADGPRGFWRLNELTGLVALETSGISLKNGVYVGGLALGDDGPMDDSKAAHFDGASGNVTVAAFPGSASFTIEAWFKSDTPTWAVDKAFFSSYPDNNGFILFCPAGTANLYTYVGSSTAVFPNIHQRNVPNIQRWNQAVLSYNAGTGSCHYRLNGGEDDSIVVSVMTRTNTNVNIELANQPGQVRFFDGLLAEMAFYPYVLTNAQIDAHYKARISATRYYADSLATTYEAVKT